MFDHRNNTKNYVYLQGYFFKSNVHGNIQIVRKSWVNFQLFKSLSPWPFFFFFKENKIIFSQTICHHTNKKKSFQKARITYLITHSESMKNPNFSTGCFWSNSPFFLSWFSCLSFIFCSLIWKDIYTAHSQKTAARDKILPKKPCLVLSHS